MNYLSSAILFILFCASLEAFEVKHDPKEVTRRSESAQIVDDPTDNHAGDKSYLIWYTSTEGLFSHFVKMKMILYYARVLGNKILVIPPFKSTHYRFIKINLCNFFDLESLNILCKPKLCKCRNDKTKCVKSQWIHRQSVNTIGQSLTGGINGTPQKFNYPSIIFNGSEYHNHSYSSQKFQSYYNSLCIRGNPPFLGMNSYRSAALYAVSKLNNIRLRINSVYNREVIEFMYGLNIFNRSECNLSELIDFPNNYNDSKKCKKLPYTVIIVNYCNKII